MNPENVNPSKTTLANVERLLLQLRFKTAAAKLHELYKRAVEDSMCPSRFIEALLSVEVDGRTERRIEKRIKTSKLPERKTLDQFDFSFQTGVDRRQVMALAGLGFMEKGRSVVLAGHSGTGKSHLAKALTLLACRADFRCRYVTAAEMLAHLRTGLVDDTLEQKLKVFTAPDLLCIDELGFDRLEQDQTRHAALFFKVIDQRYGKKSTILTTNMDFKAMGHYLGDPVVTAAMVDRLVHHAIILHIEGPSWRMHQSKLLNDQS